MLRAALFVIATAAAADAPVCGDGKLSAGEVCDDGNLRNGDGCDAECRFEVLPPSCGNGVVEIHEDCDDGNLTDNDGCSSLCGAEPIRWCTEDSVEDECDDDD